MDRAHCSVPLIRRTQPYAKKMAHRATWVEPSLLAEIEYRAKSVEHHQNDGNENILSKHKNELLLRYRSPRHHQDRNTTFCPQQGNHCAP
jgi:hypothetical protein